ncbi:hypothetical protein [Cohnella pontilimi]|uniref:hypothetical protein n=1 Tax=Cohnella pontilimi TaxID=2564100 RepID=UPI00145DDE2B|nr:hypothetical protein [Cohnella pontilimi]
MKKNKPGKEVRELGTTQSGITDHHETRYTDSAVTIEPGRAPGRVPSPDDPR